MEAWKRGYTFLSLNVPESMPKSCKISQSVPHSLGLGLACVIVGIISLRFLLSVCGGGGGEQKGATAPLDILCPPPSLEVVGK